MGPRSNASTSTVRTVDDVMSQLDTNLSRNASLYESKKFIQHLAGRNTILTSESIDELESLESFLSPITANPQALISAMMRLGAVIGGPQATSFFYPICEITDCPWDIFCPQETAEEFLRIYQSSSLAESVEQVGLNSKGRPYVVHFRKPINGMPKPCGIRVYVSNKHPMDSILSLKNSFEQTAVSASVAICFWPKLQSSGLYRTFESNSGLTQYPKGKTFYQLTVSPGKKTSLKQSMNIPSIYNGTNTRVETVVFKNTCSINNEIYSSSIKDIQNIVYCVFNSSSRYLGTTAGMN